MALYGLGNIRDERLHRAFNESLVHFVKPDDEVDQEDEEDEQEMASETLKHHFSCMLIHQNRFRGARGGMLTKNCIHDYQLPSFLDLVIWGHEHDCQVEPVPSANHAFHIVQPGSSVITSYQPAEACRPKHVAIVEVHGKRFRVLPVALSGEVFLFDDISLHESLGDLLSDGCGDQASIIEEFLHAQVARLLEIAEEERGRRQAALNKNYMATASALGYEVEGREDWWHSQVPKIQTRPLIRLRVDHFNPDGDNYPALPIQRFGARYADSLGNHQAILLFTLRAARRKGSAAGADMDELNSQRSKLTGGLGIADLTSIMEERREMGGQGIESVLNKMISHFQEKPCRILLESSLNRSLHTFVQKEDSHAIENCLEQICHGAREEVLRSIRAAMLSVSAKHR
eukprot:GHVH01009904.1.p1 GENE.GHVH01009904.1~~GHVH01009904.1.p1  ORF type:complete len:401 (-),score=56.95 GHVH01009904.1:164-1366(-)